MPVTNMFGSFSIDCTMPSDKAWEYFIFLMARSDSVHVLEQGGRIRPWRRLGLRNHLRHFGPSLGHPLIELGLGRDLARAQACGTAAHGIARHPGLDFLFGAVGTS